MTKDEEKAEEFEFYKKNTCKMTQKPIQNMPKKER